MKKIILVFGFLITSIFVVTAQNPAIEEEADCFTKWSKKFELRGADAVTDGTYSDVVITIRSTTNTDVNCFAGKCDVKDGKIVAMYMKLQDGKFELFKRKPRYEQTITINNGMSKTLMTSEEELINVLFVKKLKPKKAEFQKAPDPDAE